MKINEFPNITALGETDLLLVQTAGDGAYKNITVNDLRTALGGGSSSNSGGGSSSGGSTANYSMPGLALWLEGGSLADKSGNNNNATPIGAGTPINASGIDGKGCLVWNGLGNMELQVNPFLGNSNGSTLFCVFTVNASANYNLIRTANLDDYWYFSNNGNGYLGTYQNARNEGYPANMPSSGSHLGVLQSNSAYSQFILDNTSKGVIAKPFIAGDRFRICTNDKTFNGSISLLLVYNKELVPGQADYLQTLNAIKANYPSLTLAN